MTTTREWAASRGICVDDSVPAIAGYFEPYHRTARDVAIRAVVLHCVVATGYGVEPRPLVSWLRDEGIWDQVSPREQAFLTAESRSEKESGVFRWREEAEWALLWMVRKVDALGLPDHKCDTRRMCDDIMPPVGSPIGPFVDSAVLRPPAELLGEDDRIYDLHCRARKAHVAAPLPDDMIYTVLYQRHYAFDWVHFGDPWDEVQCDT